MKTIFSLVLIFALTSFSPYAFSDPGKRTYLGSDIKKEEVLSQETPSLSHAKERKLAEKISPKPSEPAEQINNKEPLKEEPSASDINEINKIILTKKNLSETDIANISSQNLSIEELKNTLSKTDDSSAKNSTEVTETAVSQTPIISHEGIPLKWEYKMKE